MKAGNKIAWMYMLLTLGLFVLLGTLFYLLTARAVNRIFESYLAERAAAAAEKHWEKDELDAASYDLVKKRYEETLPDVREIVLNADSPGQVRPALSEYLSPAQVEELYKGDRTVFFQKEGKNGVALYYPDNEGNFILLVLANNRYGTDILSQMGWLLLAALVVMAVLVYAAGRFYAIRLVNRIDEAYQSEKSFISNASHELNNPLTAIQGECEITLLKERDVAEYQAALHRIASETQRIIVLMKHLLFLSHGDKTILQNAIEPVRLDSLLQDLVTERIEYHSDNAGATVSANPQLLGIAIRNLLTNALKYSNGKKVLLSLRGKMIRVEDQGIGIPKEDLERISQPFYRGKNARNYRGQGVGLSLSFRILKTYGAEISIASDVGKGTVVRILFK